MKKWGVLILLITCVACSSSDIKESVVDTEPVLLILGDGNLFWEQNFFSVEELPDILNQTDIETLHLDMVDYVSVGAVHDVTEALRKASIYKISFSGESPYNIIQLNLIGDGEVTINKRKRISLSALHSHLSAVEADDKTFAFLSIEDGDEVTVGDVSHTRDLLMENGLNRIHFKKAGSQ